MTSSDTAAKIAESATSSDVLLSSSPSSPRSPSSSSSSSSRPPPPPTSAPPFPFLLPPSALSSMRAAPAVVETTPAAASVSAGPVSVARAADADVAPPAKKRTLVVCATHTDGPQAQFFLQHGAYLAAPPGSVAADVEIVLVLSGADVRLATTAGERPGRVRALNAPQWQRGGFGDFLAWGYALDTLEDVSAFAHYVFVGANAFGPFLPAWHRVVDGDVTRSDLESGDGSGGGGVATSDNRNESIYARPWWSDFCALLDAETRLAGATIEFSSAPGADDDKRDASDPRPTRVHVDATVIATDRVGLDLARSRGVFGRFADFFDDAAYRVGGRLRRADIDWSQHVLDAGHNLACMWQLYRGLDFRRVRASPQLEAMRTIIQLSDAVGDRHPYETVFSSDSEKSQHCMAICGVTAVLRSALDSKLPLPADAGVVASASARNKGKKTIGNGGDDNEKGGGEGKVVTRSSSSSSSPPFDDDDRKPGEPTTAAAVEAPPPPPPPPNAKKKKTKAPHPSVVVLCPDPLARVFDDVTATLAATLVQLGYDCRTVRDMREVDEPDAVGAYVLMNAHQPRYAFDARRHAGRYVVYNWEQCTSEYVRRPEYRALVKGARAVWNYSSFNQTQIAFDHPVQHVLPLGFHAVLRPDGARRPTTGDVAAETIDFVFVGCACKRRDAAVAELKHAGVNVHYHTSYTAFGRALQLETDAAKAVGNFHFFERPTVLEQTRIVPLLARGKVVVSERSDDTETDRVLAPFVVFVRDLGRDLLKKCRKFLRDPVRRLELRQKVWDEFPAAWNSVALLKRSGVLDTLFDRSAAASSSSPSPPRPLPASFFSPVVASPPTRSAASSSAFSSSLSSADRKTTKKAPRVKTPTAVEIRRVQFGGAEVPIDKFLKAAASFVGDRCVHITAQHNLIQALGDPTPGVAKSLVIDYVWHGAALTRRGNEYDFRLDAPLTVGDVDEVRAATPAWRCASDFDLGFVERFAVEFFAKSGSGGGGGNSGGDYRGDDGAVGDGGFGRESKRSKKKTATVPTAVVATRDPRGLLIGIGDGSDAVSERAFGTSLYPLCVALDSFVERPDLEAPPPPPPPTARVEHKTVPPLPPSPASVGEHQVQDRLVGRAHVGELRDTGLPTAAYDYLLAAHVLQRVANPLALLHEWRRLVRAGGWIVATVPWRHGTADRLRPYTTIEHLRDDLARRVTEADATHTDEIVRLHDYARDPVLRNGEMMAEHAAKNAQHRTLPHHVFSQELLFQIASELGFEVLEMDVCGQNDLVCVYRVPTPALS